MLTIRLIHGIHAPEGANNMSALLPHMRDACPDADVQLFGYGFMGFWQARWRNNDVASRLAAVWRNGAADQEVWITHSNGAAVAYLATHSHGARPRMVININPALDRHLAAIAPAVEVIHSDGDRWVDVAQWLPGHIWGDQGKMGYGSTWAAKARRTDVINHRASAPDFGNMAYDNHTGLFKPKRIAHWSRFIAHRIDERLGSIK